MGVARAEECDCVHCEALEKDGSTASPRCSKRNCNRESYDVEMSHRWAAGISVAPLYSVPGTVAKTELSSLVFPLLPH